MIPPLTPTLSICVAGALVTGGLLFLPADDEPTGTDAYGQPTDTDAYGQLTDTDDPTTSVDVPDPDITVADFAFGDPIIVSAGATVAVLNVDAATHTLTARDGAFDTGGLSKDATKVFEVPTETGTYAFFCTFHPSMTGELIVE